MTSKGGMGIFPNGDGAFESVGKRHLHNVLTIHLLVSIPVQTLQVL